MEATVLIVANGCVLGVAQAGFCTAADPYGPLPGQTVGPQSSSNPCIIAATQCQQPAGFGWINVYFEREHLFLQYVQHHADRHRGRRRPGYPYTVSQLLALGSDTFNIAIDVNTTGAAGETLQLFEVIINGVVAYNYVGPTNIGVINANGNGYADWTLGLVSLSRPRCHRHGALPRGVEQCIRRWRVVLPASPNLSAGRPGLWAARGSGTASLGASWLGPAGVRRLPPAAKGLISTRSAPQAARELGRR